MPVITWEQVCRPWPGGGGSLLDAPRQDEQLRLALVERLLAGEGEQRPDYPKFSKRDLERTNLVVAAVAPHLAFQIELAIKLSYPRRNIVPGHPSDPMTERASLAFELLRCCRVRRPARTLKRILETLEKHVTEESIERNYRRRNKGRLVRVAGGFLSQVPPGDLHRVLLWRLQSLLSPSPASTAAIAEARRAN